jgi:DNA-binding CsgD family transcriptional regulator
MGLSFLAVVWLSSLRLRNIRLTFELLLIALCLTTAINMALYWMPWYIESSIRLTLACIGSLGALRATGSTWQTPAPAMSTPLLDYFRMPFAKSLDSSTRPSSHILSLVVTPLAVLLLFVVNRGINGNTTTFVGGLYTPEMIAGLLCAPSAAVLLFARNNRNFISIVCRLYLPMLALALFAIVPFITGDLKILIMHIGIDIFCLIYSLLLFAILLTTTSHTPSLSISSATLLLIVLGSVALLTFRGIEAGFLGSYQPQVCIALFTCVVALMLIAPDTQIWQTLMKHTTLENNLSALSLQERCVALAKANKFTERETEIIPLLGRGYSASYVAEALVVAESTIRSHRSNIYRKLNISSREELLKLLDDPAIDNALENNWESC